MKTRFSYYEICQKLEKDGWQEKWLNEGMVPYAYGDGDWVGYDNVRSIAYKVEMLKSYGLGGVMWWAPDLDDFNGEFCGEGEYPLMTAARSALEGYTPESYTGGYTRPTYTTNGFTSSPITDLPVTMPVIPTDTPETYPDVTTDSITIPPPMKTVIVEASISTTFSYDEVADTTSDAYKNAVTVIEEELIALFLADENVETVVISDITFSRGNRRKRSGDSDQAIVNFTADITVDTTKIDSESGSDSLEDISSSIQSTIETTDVSKLTAFDSSSFSEGFSLTVTEPIVTTPPAEIVTTPAVGLTDEDLENLKSRFEEQMAAATNKSLELVQMEANLEEFEQRILNVSMAIEPPCDIRVAKCGSWSSWSFLTGTCSVTCGRGRGSFQRCFNFKDTNIPFDEINCESKNDYCWPGLCPRWDKWSIWGPCSSTCRPKGSASPTKERYRCWNTGTDWITGRSAVIDCGAGKGDKNRYQSQKRQCNSKKFCTGVCEWSEWGEWSQCNPNCDEGLKIRRRTSNEGDRVICDPNDLR